MASSRFPGKPLLKVMGLPMVEHVSRRALLCGEFSEVVVATCDLEIARVVEGFGGRCLMTSASHPGGTDRVAEAVGQLSCTHAVNVQGDQILVLPQDLKKMVAAIQAEPDVPAWCAVASLERQEELSDLSVVKSALSRSGRILLCARDFSTLPRTKGFEPFRRILGILGFRKDFLDGYPQLPRTPLEVAESIDQSRIVENDVCLKAVLFSKGYPEINEPREVDLVLKIFETDPLQQFVVEGVETR
jgi:3-deoxy-manno-octulosonate cytidylyltransferase (CMP-KDO synthetase)